MSNIPTAVKKRLITTVPKFKKILIKAKERDINEADTVTIVTDMLEEIFGFNKYSEITREYSTQGTYCDLAIRTQKKIEYLIEVKAVGLELASRHLRQAVNYASRDGVKWVVLTNGIKWDVHRVILENKVKNERLFTLDFTEINPRQSDQQDLLFLLCKRGVTKELIGDFYEYRQSVNRYTVGALLLTDPVVSVVRRELRKLKQGIKVDADEIKSIVQNQIIKREVLDSGEALAANKQIAKFIRRQERAKKQSTAQTENTRAKNSNTAKESL